MTSTPPPAFADNDACLTELMALGNLLIERALTPSSPATAGSDPLARLSTLARSPSDHLEEAIAYGWTRLAERSRASIAQELFSPWVHLCALFQPDRNEQILLIAGLLPALDPRYRALLRRLAEADGSETGDSNAVPLAALSRLLDGPSPRTALVRCLAEDAVPRHWQLIESAGSAGLDALDAAGSYRLAPVIAAYLLGQAAPRPQLDEPLEELPVAAPLADLPLNPDERQQLERFIAYACRPDSGAGGFLLQLQGPDTPLQQAVTAALFARLGLVCLRLDAAPLLRLMQDGQPPGELHRRLRALCRDALLCNRVLILVNTSSLVDGENDDRLRLVLNTLFISQRFVAVLNGPARRLADLAHLYGGHTVRPALIRLEPPGMGLRREIWRYHCHEQGLGVEETQMARLAERHPFTDEVIGLAAREAAARRMTASADIPLDALLDEVCRDQAQRHPLAVAQEVRSPHRLSDIVLPPSARQAMDDILADVRYRRRVIGDWGFDACSDNPDGLCVLFHGPSGTGKTMAASIIANELGLALYKIDLAGILSKYIGETEKHLARLFDQAEALNVILFFDEAEGLFSKRTETHDSHDRYANLQTGYLLQRIERYAGTVILSTNLLKNLDKAFTRRFRFMVEFPFPGPDERLRLWTRAFPPQAPLAAPLDLPALAEHLAVSGGTIKNIAFGAAILAAAAGGAITGEHVRQAAEREYLKLGKVFPAALSALEDDV